MRKETILKRNELSAVIISASKDDWRKPYFTHVCVELMPDKSVILSTTDGHRLTAIKCEEQHTINTDNVIKILMPVKDVEKILKVADKRMSKFVLAQTDTACTLAGIPFIAADMDDVNDYPDWRVLVPDHNFEEDTNSNYYAFYMLDAIKTIAIFHKCGHTPKKPYTNYKLFKCGKKPALLKGESDNCLVILMPYDDHTTITNDGREWALKPVKV